MPTGLQTVDACADVAYITMPVDEQRIRSPRTSLLACASLAAVIARRRHARLQKTNAQLNERRLTSIATRMCTRTLLDCFDTADARHRADECSEDDACSWRCSGRRSMRCESC